MILAYICTPCRVPKLRREEIPPPPITPSESWEDSMQGPIYYEGDDPKAAAGGVVLKQDGSGAKQRNTGRGNDEIEDVIKRGYYDDKVN